MGFEKFYKTSYNELRQEAKDLEISTWRKTKEDLIEELIAEHKRLY